MLDSQLRSASATQQHQLHFWCPNRNRPGRCLQLTVDVGELIDTKGSNTKASFPNAPLRRFSVPTQLIGW